MNNVLFTQHFSIRKKQGDIEFVDIYIYKDKKFFIDPAKLLKYNDPMSISMNNRIVSYFSKLLKAIKEKNKTKSLIMLRNLKEMRETHLGYAVNGYAGNAVGEGFGMKKKNVGKRLKQNFLYAMVNLSFWYLRN